MMKKIILFICRGNRFRSRIAEEIFNKNPPEGYVARSAGVHYQRWNDRAVTKALREIGIEITKRKPRKLMNSALAKASRIIAFDGVKIHGVENWPIKDCHAGDIECIRKGRKQIEKRVNALIKSL